MYEMIRKVSEINDVAPRLVINSNTGSAAIAGIVGSLGGETAGKPKEEAPAVERKPAPKRKHKPGVTRAFDRIKNETVEESDERLSSIPDGGEVYILSEETGEVVRGTLVDHFEGSPVARVRVGGISGVAEKTRIVGAPAKPSPASVPAAEKVVERLSEEEVALESERLGVEEEALAEALHEESAREINEEAEERRQDLEEYDPQPAPVEPEPPPAPEAVVEAAHEEHVEEVSDGQNPPPVLRARGSVAVEKDVSDRVVRKDASEVSTTPTQQALDLGSLISDSVSEALELGNLESYAASYNNRVGLPHHKGVQPTALEVGLAIYLEKNKLYTSARDFVLAREVLFSRTIDPEYRDTLNEMNTLELEYELLVRVSNPEERHRGLTSDDAAKREILLGEAARVAASDKSTREIIQSADNITEAALISGHPNQAAYENDWHREMLRIDEALKERGFTEEQIVGLASMPLMRLIEDRGLKPGDVTFNEDGTVTVPKYKKRGPKPKVSPEQAQKDDQAKLASLSEMYQSVLDRIVAGEPVASQDIPTVEEVVEASKDEVVPLTEEQTALIESVSDKFIDNEKMTTYLMNRFKLPKSARDDMPGYINEALVRAARTYDKNMAAAFDTWVVEKLGSVVLDAKRKIAKDRARQAEIIDDAVAGRESRTVKTVDDEANLEDAFDAELSEEEAGTIVQSAQDLAEQNREADAQRELDRPKRRLVQINAPLWLTDLLNESGDVGKKVALLVQDNGKIPAEEVEANKAEVLQALSHILEKEELSASRAKKLLDYVERLLDNVPEGERLEELETITEEQAKEENAVQEAVNEVVAHAEDVSPEVYALSTDTPAKRRERRADSPPVDVSSGRLYYHPQSGEFFIAQERDESKAWPEGMHEGILVDLNENEETGKIDVLTNIGKQFFPVSEVEEAPAIDPDKVGSWGTPSGDVEVQAAIDRAAARARTHEDKGLQTLVNTRPEDWDAISLKQAKDAIRAIENKLNEKKTGTPTKQETDEANDLMDRLSTLEAAVENAERAQRGEATLSVSREKKRGRAPKAPVETAGDLLEGADLPTAPKNRRDNLKLQLETATEGRELDWLRTADKQVLADAINATLGQDPGREIATIKTGLLTGEWPPGWAEVAEARKRNFSPSRVQATLSVSNESMLRELERYKARVVETSDGEREVQITVVPADPSAPPGQTPFDDMNLKLLLDLLEGGELDWLDMKARTARAPKGHIGIAAKVSSPSGLSVADATQIVSAMQQAAARLVMNKGEVPKKLRPAIGRLSKTQSVEDVANRALYEGGKPQSLPEARRLANTEGYTYDGEQAVEALKGRIGDLVADQIDRELDRENEDRVSRGRMPHSQASRVARHNQDELAVSKEIGRRRDAVIGRHGEGTVLVNKAALDEDSELVATEIAHAHRENGIGKNGIGFEDAALGDILRIVGGMRGADGKILWPELDQDSGEFSVESMLQYNAILAAHLSEHGTGESEQEYHQIVEDSLATYGYVRDAENSKVASKIIKARIRNRAGRYLAKEALGGNFGHSLLKKAFLNLNRKSGEETPLEKAKSRGMKDSFDGKTLDEVKAVFGVDADLNSGPLATQIGRSFESAFLGLYGNRTVTVGDPRGFADLAFQRILGIDPVYQQDREGQEYHPLFGMIGQERPTAIYETYRNRVIREATRKLQGRGGASINGTQALAILAAREEQMLNRVGAHTGRSEFDNSIPDLAVHVEAAANKYMRQENATPFNYSDALSRERAAGRSRPPVRAEANKQEAVWRSLSVGRGRGGRRGERRTPARFNKEAQDRAEVLRAQRLSAKDRGEEDNRRRSDAEVRAAGEAKLNRHGARKIVAEAVKVARNGRASSGFNDVDQVALTLAINQMTSSERRENVEAVSLATAASLTIAGEFARGLRASGTVLSETDQRLRALHNAAFMPQRKLHHRLEQLRKKGNHLEAEKLHRDWAKGRGEFSGKGLPSLHKYLRSMGVDPFALDNLGNDPVAARRVLALADQHKADVMDGAFEFWRNGILGAMTTQMANIVGTVPYTLWEVGVKRNLEALVNLSVQDPSLPTFEENAVIFKHMIMNMGTAARYGWQAFKEEAPIVEARLGFEGRGRTKIEGMRTSIKGKKGKVIRTPQNVLLGVDEYMKYVIANGFAAGYALRASRHAIKEGRISQAESAAFIERAMLDKDRSIYTPAMNETLRLLWQQPLGKAGQHLTQLRDTIKPLRFLMPFIVTPANIFKTGVRLSPVGIGNLMMKGAQARAEGKSVREAWKDLSPLAAEQVISWMAMFAIMGLGEDEEETGLPWITGSSQEWETGSRQASGREGMPPSFSVRMFGKWWSYERIEPFATVVGSLVDVAEGLKSGDPSVLAGNTAKGLYGQLYNKTFTRSFADLIDAGHSWQQRGFLSGAGHWATTFASSWMPNYVRSTGRALQESVPERGLWGDEEELKDRTYDRLRAKLELGLVDNTPKVDIWGREISRPQSPDWARQMHAPTSDFLYNLFVPVRNKSSDLFVGDRVLLNWNSRDDVTKAKYPRAPRRNMTFGGEKRNFSDKQYEEYSLLAGQIAQQLVSSANLNVDNPTQRDIDLITDSISRARSMARRVLGPKFFGGGQIRKDLQIPQVAEEIRFEQVKSKARVLTEKPPSMKSLSVDEKLLPMEKRQVILQRLKDELDERKLEAAEALKQQGYDLKDVLKAHGKGTTGRRRIVSAMTGGA